MEFTIAAAVLGVIILLWYVLTYNSLVNARNAVDQAWSQIEVELKRRYDLIQNLVEVAKSYAKFESDTFQKVAQLRGQPRPFVDATAANAAQPNMIHAVNRIMVLAEDYPQLRADKSFLNLQTELAVTENRIAERRHAYNQSVNAYANRLQSFPSNLVAQVQGMPKRAFFDAPDAEVHPAPRAELT